MNADCSLHGKRTGAQKVLQPVGLFLTPREDRGAYKSGTCCWEEDAVTLSGPGKMFIAIAAAVLLMLLLGLYFYPAPDAQASLSLEQVRVTDVAVFQGLGHDTSKFVAFVEAVAEKKGAAPLKGCRQVLSLNNQTYKSNLQKEFAQGDHRVDLSMLIFVPRSSYRRQGQLRMVCQTAVSDWYPVELPELKS